jgi:hypothetical protein
MAQQWNTLHIFGYGESQAIGEDYNKKTNTSDLLTAQAVIDDVYAQKPVGNDASADYRVITIFNDYEAVYFPNIGDNFTVPFSQLNATLCQALVDEINIAVP